MILMFGLVGCGNSGINTNNNTTQDITNTQALQSIKALFSTEVGTTSVNVNILPDVNPVPFITDALFSGYSNCVSGSATRDHQLSTVYTTFDNCEIDVQTATFDYSIPPVCISKIIISGSFTFEISNNPDNHLYGQKITGTISSIKITTNGIESTMTSCVLDTLISYPDTAPWTPITYTGTICGVDINTITNACSE